MAESNGFVFRDVTEWKMKEIRAFNRDVRDVEGQIKQAMVLVESWPYDGDPASDTSYDDLELEEWQALRDAMVEHVAQRFQ